MENAKKMLCAIDPGNGSAEVCRQTAALARALQAEVLLLHVPASLEAWRRRDGHEQAELGERGEIVESGRSPLAGPIAEHFAGIPARGRAALGDPAETIVRVAREEGCLFIVMGRRRGGLAGQLQPSVAESVGRIAELPLMLVGPVPDAESGRPGPLPSLTRT